MYFCTLFLPTSLCTTAILNYTLLRLNNQNNWNKPPQFNSVGASCFLSGCVAISLYRAGLKERPLPFILLFWNSPEVRCGVAAGPVWLSGSARRDWTNPQRQLVVDCWDFLRRFIYFQQSGKSSVSSPKHYVTSCPVHSDGGGRGAPVWEERKTHNNNKLNY